MDISYISLCISLAALAFLCWTLDRRVTRLEKLQRQSIVQDAEYQPADHE